MTGEWEWVLGRVGDPPGGPWGWKLGMETVVAPKEGDMGTGTPGGDMGHPGL